MKTLLILLLLGNFGASATIIDTVVNVNQWYKVEEKNVKAEIINHAVKGRFHVELPAVASDLYAVSMYDSLGRIVYQSTLPQNKQKMLSLNIHYLPKGKYILKIKSLNKECAYSK